MVTRNGVPAAVLASTCERGSWRETCTMRIDPDPVRDVGEGRRSLGENRNGLRTP